MTNVSLNSHIFEKDIKDLEQMPIRKGFGEGLVIAAKANSAIVGLCADLTDSTFMHLFKKEFPKSFVEVGVAEQNLASVASGMAAMGKLPFITSYAMFSPGRNWEQIRTTICYNDRKVIVVGSHAGLSVGPDGGTHQAIEDIAITRVIPNMTVIVPCDVIEAKKATIALAKDSQNGGTDSPAYLRLAREKSPVVTTEETPFVLGKAQILFDATQISDDSLVHAKADVGIIACGVLVYKALRVAKALESEGVKAIVMNLATIKPLDTEAIVSLAKRTGCIVTAEEHQVAAGMGGTVAECLVKEFPVPIEFVGVEDTFGQSGTPDELLEHYCLSESHIREAALKVIKRK